jgi:hypothetical protein
MNEGYFHPVEKDLYINFKQRLNEILYMELTVENIRTFADEALEKLISLNEAVVKKYQNEHKESNSYSGVELEDYAYTTYGLENLNVILSRITEVQDKIISLAIEVAESLNKTTTIITPPDKTNSVFSNTDEKTYEPPKQLDRLLTLAYILERDFNLSQNDVRYTQGITNNHMMRSEPYTRVEIDDLNRLVYVCDEEGNASYVFDTDILDQLGITYLELDTMSKNSRNALLRTVPSAGTRIKQNQKWRTMVSTVLSEPFAKTEESKQISILQSEFTEKPKFLEFENFLSEVRTAYEKDGSPRNVLRWYRNEYQQQAGWPSRPDKKYHNQGWISWVDMVGRKNNIL